MKWNEAVMALRHTNQRNQRKLARVMALAWRSAEDHGSDALLVNLQSNSLDCLGVAWALDTANVPPPGDALELLLLAQ